MGGFRSVTAGHVMEGRRVECDGWISFPRGRLWGERGVGKDRR